MGALSERGRMDASELARTVFSVGRHSPPTAAQLASTYRAVRCLIAKGKVIIAGRCRRRRLFALPADPLLSDLVVEFHD